jgi:hypothetical protein
MSYSVLDSFNRSQFLSTKVEPMAIPRICVCAAPLTPTAQRSLFIEVMPGATAVGGGDLTVVVDSVVLLEVESVIIGSTAYTDVVKNPIIDNIIIFFIVDSPPTYYI